MPIVTRRAKGNAEVIIDHELCNLCGLCVNVCKGPLYIENDRLQVINPFYLVVSSWGNVPPFVRKSVSLLKGGK